MKILSIDEIYTILREVNYQIMNSLPLDFVNFINLPYFKNMRDEDLKMIPTTMMIEENYLRCFYTTEVFLGMKRIELMKDT